MPAPKRTSSRTTTSSAAKPAAKRTATAARSGAKGTATSAKKATSRTATQAKSGASKTAGSAKSGAAKTKRAARTGKQTRTTAKSAATKAKRASGSADSASVAEQLAKGTLKPADVLILTRERVQEALDDAATRGRVTRKDANDLVTDLVNRGRHHGDEFRKEFDNLIERGRGQLESAGKRARRAPVADRIVRGADRARRAAGVGPSFPILGYDDLNANQVQSRIGELSKPDVRKVLSYEKSHADRKTVTSALEKALA
jgi:polyhydroxyalkanoate synthesis regulator phasin